ncbi:MAG: MBL fold metallo-hydrolase [Chthoniobacteraceae bacterium]
MNVTWLTQGGFLFERNGFRMVVDPYMSDSLAGKVTRIAAFPLPLDALRPDAVLCTHDHLDHLDPETILMLSERYPESLYAAPERGFRHLAELGIAAPRLLKRETPDAFGPFNVTPVFARHSDPSAVGLLVDDSECKIYLTGDTEYDKNLFSAFTAGSDVLLICINGRLGNMTWEDAVRTAAALKPKAAIPMHYGLFAENTANPVPFISACQQAGIGSFEMKAGETFCV